MSTKSLAAHLNRTLSRLEAGSAPVRTAVVGVGSELHGDDAAGILAARALLPRLHGHDRLLVIDAGPAPENCTGALRRFRPDLVLLIDAAQMNAPAGTVRWLSWQAIDGISASTHTLPLHLVAQFLQMELGCEVALIGIQPAQNAMFAPISAVAQRAVDQVVEILARLAAANL